MKHIACVALVMFLSGAALAADRLALVIGIDNYQTLGALTTCANDARCLGGVLSQVGYKPEHVVVLTDDSDDQSRRPTLANVRRRVAQFADLSATGDTLFVFFSGHGVTIGNEGYLVPMDGDATAEGAIPLVWVKDQMSRSKASLKILTLDACHAGSAAKGVAGIVPTLATPAGMLMFLSSTRDQVSYPNPQTGRSVFSECLATGLAGAAAGADRRVTAAALFAYVSDRMKTWSLQSGKMQTPLLVGEPPSGLILASVPWTGTVQLSFPARSVASTLEQNWMTARANMLQRKARFDQIDKLTGDELLSAVQRIVQDPSLSALQKRLSEAEMALRELSMRVGDAHPLMMAAQASIADTRSTIDATLGRIKKGLLVDYEVAKDEYEAIDKVIWEAKNQPPIASMLEQNRTTARANILQRKARLDQINKLMGDELISAVERIVQDPTLCALQKQLTEAEMRLRELSVNLAPSHPQVVAVQTSITNIRSTIDATLGRIKKGLLVDYEVAKDEYEAIDKVIQEAKSQPRDVQ